MESEREIFSLSGPLHLTAVDWNNAHHRRSVVASLVEGVYFLERDRHGPQANAPPWWEFFHIQSVNVLVDRKDDKDSSIFGAIYELKPHPSYYNYSVQSAPKYIIAFRGTLPKPHSMCADLKLDLRLTCNGLHKTSRFEIAMQAVKHMVDVAGVANIWLAGHSLGSAIAMLAGKNMAKMNLRLETYLFNPPFLSTPIERINNPNLKFGIRVASSVFKAAFAVAVKGRHQRPEDEPFVVLSEWIPNLFVNPADHICSEYVGYFQHRKKMEEIGARKIERIATQHSTRSLFFSSFGKDSEPLHLLPSANLTTNLSHSPSFRGAHGIDQWWRPDLHCQSEQHEFGYCINLFGESFLVGERFFIAQCVSIGGRYIYIL